MSTVDKVATTADRLRQIMIERNLKQIDIVRLCSPYCELYGERLEKNDVSQYVSGKVAPGQRKLTILGSALNVSEPWLMGYDVSPIRGIEQDEYTKTFCESVEEQLELSDPADVADSNVNYERLSEVAGGVNNISLSEACNIADELGCSLDIMVGKKTPAGSNTDGYVSEFVELFSKLTDEQQALIISSIKGILSNQ